MIWLIKMCTVIFTRFDTLWHAFDTLLTRFWHAFDTLPTTLACTGTPRAKTKVLIKAQNVSSQYNMFEAIKFTLVDKDPWIIYVFERTFYDHNEKPFKCTPEIGFRRLRRHTSESDYKINRVVKPFPWWTRVTCSHLCQLEGQFIWRSIRSWSYFSKRREIDP